MDFKARIKTIIIDHCKGSNKKFAKELGINVSTIQVWDDTHLPKGDILQRMHDVFNVNVTWLLTGQGDPYIKDRKKDGPLHIKDKSGLWGKTDQIEFEGTPFTVTKFSLEDAPDDTKADIRSDKIKVSEALTMAARVLESNTTYATALYLNVQHFDRAIRAEGRLLHFEKVNDAQAAKILDLESRLAALEKKIRSLEEKQKNAVGE